MIGIVNPQNEAILNLRVRGEKRLLEISVVIDTGFNDYLTMRPGDIEALGLEARESVFYLLADGSEVEMRLFVAEVEWMGIWRQIFVAENDGGPLAGMALLTGHHIGIDVIDGGRVEIRQLALP